MKESPFKAHVTSVEPLDHGKWIQTRKINYTDPNGKARVWEMAIRTTRSDTTGIDAVSILGIIHGRGAKQIVLTKQFRPPCGKVVVEMPAGLVDPNESIESTAERELLEETGYKGTVDARSTPVLFSDPGLTNANMSLVTVNIEASDNEDPQPQLEDGEFIEVFTLPLVALHDGLVAVSQAEDVAIDSRLFHFAEGIKTAQALGL